LKKQNNYNLYIKNKSSIRRILNILLILILIILLFFIIKEFWSIILVRNDIRKLNSKIITYNLIIDSLKAEELKLRKDTFYIEKMAREKFGMIKKREKVYHFIDKNNDENMFLKIIKKMFK
jgi:cell division protein FtsB